MSPIDIVMLIGGILLTLGTGVFVASEFALVNLDPNRAMPVSVAMTGLQATQASGRIVTGPTMDAHNSFDSPDAVTPQPFADARIAGGTLSVTVPAKSVLVLDLR